MITEIQEGLSRFDNWYGFDTENDENGKVTVTCLVHESGERWIWNKAGEFVKWCEKAKGTPIVVCHNLEYDLVNEFGSLYPYLQLNYLKGRLISAKYKSVKFVDSFNHFRMSLRDLGDSVGVKKLEMDIYSEEYVATDAWICLMAIVKARDYIASLGGSIGATSGSSSVSVWQYMTDGEFLLGPLDTPWYRKGYYGGRVEPFLKRTDGMVRGFDINSMYPFCMLCDFPEYSVPDDTMEKSKGMAEVTISIPHDLFVAPLVFRDPNQRLLYPVGVIKGCWTYDEIRFAESVGAKVLKVHKGMGCNSLVRPFDDFILTLYKKRKESTDKAERLFLKVLMNSLYGKIASKNQITRTVSRHTLLNNKSSRIGEVKWINKDRGLLDYFTPPDKYVNVVWGSMITANSRILLTKYLMKVPPEQLVYCDTDSVYTLDPFKFPESPDLGKMKLEKEREGWEFYQPKCYRHGEVFRAKGVPRSKRNGDDIVDHAKEYIEDGFTEFMAPIRFRQSINSKQGVANQWIKKSKSRSSEYTHKIFSKGRYFPPVIGEQLELFSCSKRGKITAKT